MLIFGAYVVIYNHSVALSQSGGMREHLLRVASERERIVQYAVHCRVTGCLGDLSTFERKWVTNNESKTEIYLEYSRIDQHFITAVRNMAQADSKWILLGASGDIGIVGRADEPMKVLNLDSVNQRGFGRADARHTRLRSFDPMAVGLVFCSDFYGGLSYEAQLGDLLNTPSKIQSEITETESIVTWTRNTDTLMEFDKMRGYWPTRLDYNFGEITWAVETGKHKDYFVPTKAVLTCNSTKSAGKRVTSISFDWTSVNEEFSVGRDALTRLADKFGLQHEN